MPAYKPPQCDSSSYCYSYNCCKQQENCYEVCEYVGGSSYGGKGGKGGYYGFGGPNDDGFYGDDGFGFNGGYYGGKGGKGGKGGSFGRQVCETICEPVHHQPMPYYR